jgi:glycosyltransferase involved in cell wall biosynthesis
MINTQVVHITSVHTPYDIRIFHKECRTLAEDGYAVSLVVPKDEAGISSRDGVTIVAVKQSRGRLRRILLTSPRVARQAFILKAAVYHLHDPELLIIAVLLRVMGKKVIFDMHENLPRAILTKDWIPEIARPAISKFVRLLERMFLSGLPIIFAEESYVKDYSWVSTKAVIMNMPLLAEIQSIKEEKNNLPSLGYLGMVSEARGCMNTLRALDIVKKEGVNVRWECVGRVNIGFKDAMISFAKSCNLDEVRIWGNKDATEAWRIMARCHIGMAILAPDQNYIESYPTKLFEYMAMGIPVIASNFPLYRTIVEGERCGICVDPLRVEEIAQAILYLLRNPLIAAQMGESGKLAVEKKYNWNIEKVKLLEFYKQILSARENNGMEI